MQTTATTISITKTISFQWSLHHWPTSLNLCRIFPVGLLAVRLKIRVLFVKVLLSTRYFRRSRVITIYCQVNEFIDFSLCSFKTCNLLLLCLRWGRDARDNTIASVSVLLLAGKPSSEISKQVSYYRYHNKRKSPINGLFTPFMKLCLLLKLTESSLI